MDIQILPSLRCLAAGCEARFVCYEDLKFHLEISEHKKLPRLLPTSLLRCPAVGCKIQLSDHQRMISHVKYSHSETSNIITCLLPKTKTKFSCPYLDCEFFFVSHDCLQKHVSRWHNHVFL